MAEITRIGFLGFGDMGLPMAKRIAIHGYQLTVCGHVRREPIEEMKAMGATEVNTPKKVAQDSEVTITMVRDETQSEQVILGPDGILEGASVGSGIVMMNTLPPDFCRRVNKAAKAKEVAVIDAPVAGASIGAERGQLAISVGGPAEVVERYRPILETMGTIVYCGDVGMGQVVKLSNNMAALVNAMAAAEAVSWGVRNGANEEQLVNLMRMGSANSWFLQNWEYVKPRWTAPQPPGVGIPVKDLSMALRIGEELRQPCPFTALACEFWKAGPPRLPQIDNR